MQPIDQGVHAFRTAVFPKMADRFQELSTGQSPDTLFITCSDSRVDPSLITQLGPGELFVHRNAGNFISPWGAERSVDSAIEYAVAVLKVKQVVICGHSGCGAVGGALAPEGLEGLPAVKDWVVHAQPAVDATAHLHGDERLPATVAENVRVQLSNLRAHPSVAAALEEGRLVLRGWVYDIGSGAITDVVGSEALS